MSSTEQITEQFLDLLQDFVHVRPHLMTPDHVVRLKQQMQSLKNSGLANWEDRPFLFRILIILVRRKTPPTMGELSNELGIPLSSATRLVDGLVNADFVERTNDPNDRRVVRIQLTHKGQQFSETTMHYVKYRITSLLGNFTPEEQEQLLMLMTKLLNSLMADQQTE